MKNTILSLIVVVLISTVGSVAASSGPTIEASGLSGSWWPRRDHDEVVIEIGKMRSTEIALEVDADNQASIARKYQDGTIERVKTTSFRQIGSLFYWTFERDDELEYQLVLGGWQLEGGTSVLFGHLYLANAVHGLFNGWPVAVQQGK